MNDRIMEDNVHSRQATYGATMDGDVRSGMGRTWLSMGKVRMYLCQFVQTTSQQPHHLSHCLFSIRLHHSLLLNGPLQVSTLMQAHTPPPLMLTVSPPMPTARPRSIVLGMVEEGVDANAFDDDDPDKVRGRRHG